MVGLITRVRAVPVNIPLNVPYHCSVGVYSGFTTTVIEIHTEDGLVGIGEAPTGQSARVIEDRIAPALIGANPLDLAQCERRAVPPVNAYRNIDDNSIVLAWGGVETALWDLKGKAYGCSIADLLGGRVREHVEFTEYFGLRAFPSGMEDITHLAAYCAAMVEEHGAQGFEGKAGVLDIRSEVKMVKEIRAAVGDDAMLRLDANMAYSLTAAREVMHRLEPFNISSFEEPVASLRELSLLRDSTSISFSSHEPNLQSALTHRVPDSFVINVAVLGGIRRTVAFASACEAVGLNVWFYAEPGISTAAQLQVASALPWIKDPSQTLARWQTDDVIAGGPFEAKDGAISVPTGPGLGVELDTAALQRCNDRYRNDGPLNPYKNPAPTTRWYGR
jgi:L-alanine-DL-glutamate epimerase and related enzymes of enolase superfamily